MVFLCGLIKKKNIKTSGKHKDSEANTSQFFENVYAIVVKIPKGRVTSYGAIAKALGAAKSSRIVGYAMNESHKYLPHLAAHRVVNRIGLLTGKHHFGTEDEMQKLLESEGHKIVNDKIVDFDKVFWDPAIELV